MHFSVLMSVYKNDNIKALKECMESILANSVLPNEIVLYEDGPISKEMEELILFYEKNNQNIFTVVRLKENIGLGNVLRMGVVKCKYPLIARMDSDDICVKDRFKKQLNEFKKDKNLDMVGGYILEFDNDDETKTTIREVPLNLDEIKKYSKKRNPFSHVSLMYKKEAVLKAGNYIDQKYFEDYYLWLRMIKSGAKMKNLSDILVKVRAGGDMMKRRGGASYLKYQISFQNRVYKEGLISFFDYLFNISVRSFVSLMPTSFRKLTYNKVLRRDSNE